jgi:hypothetical protein
MRAGGTLYDNFFKFSDQTMKKWDELVPAYTPPISGKFAEILVPTVDTVRYSWLQE